MSHGEHSSSLDDAEPDLPRPADNSVIAERSALVPGAGPELLEDGQEEVFAYSAVERGQVEDPKALGPEDLARAPKSPGSLARPEDAP
jgi:hypothetical protein